MLNHLSRWIDVDEDWCTLAEADLSVEAIRSRLHLVNTFLIPVDARYFASVKVP